MTQFACRPEYQHQISEQGGIKLVLDCMKTSWPKDEQVQLYALSAIYTCLRLNNKLCSLHVKSIVEPVVDSMKAYPAMAKINLFGCWILYELAVNSDTLPFLCHSEMIKYIQAIQTRFHDDELLKLATENVLDWIAKDETAEIKEAKRLGIAFGGLS